MQLLTEKEASAMLSVSVHTLRTWRRLGSGPKYVKLNKLVRYPLKDLEEFSNGEDTKTEEAS